MSQMYSLRHLSLTSLVNEALQEPRFKPSNLIFEKLKELNQCGIRVLDYEFTTDLCYLQWERVSLRHLIIAWENSLKTYGYPDEDIRYDLYCIRISFNLFKLQPCCSCWCGGVPFPKDFEPNERGEGIQILSADFQGFSKGHAPNCLKAEFN